MDHVTALGEWLIAPHIGEFDAVGRSRRATDCQQGKNDDTPLHLKTLRARAVQCLQSSRVPAALRRGTRSLLRVNVMTRVAYCPRAACRAAIGAERSVAKGLRSSWARLALS